MIKLLKPILPIPVLFTHIPKCGGTSVDAAIQKKFQITGPQLNFEALRRVNKKLANQADLVHMMDSAKLVLLYTAEQGATYLSGHFPVTKSTLNYLNTLKPFLTVTLIRDPYQRLESNYIYHRIRLWELGYEVPQEVDEGKEDSFLEHQRELLLKFYDSDEGNFQLNLYAYMFGEGCHKTAQQTLEHFDVVGILEKMPLFTTEISKLLKRKVPLQKLNQIENRPYKQQAKLFRQLFKESQIETDLKIRLRKEIDLYQWASSCAGKSL